MDTMTFERRMRLVERAAHGAVDTRKARRASRVAGQWMVAYDSDFFRAAARKATTRSYHQTVKRLRKARERAAR